jgi:hypothetical protein
MSFIYFRPGDALEFFHLFSSLLLSAPANNSFFGTFKFLKGIFMAHHVKWRANSMVKRTMMKGGRERREESESKKKGSSSG